MIIVLFKEIKQLKNKKKNYILTMKNNCLKESKFL